MSGLFEAIFGPPTPEQRKQMELMSLKQRQRTEETVKQVLPTVQEMRKLCRELTRAGFDDERVHEIRHQLATLADDLQNYLERPPPPDTSDNG